MSFFDFYFNSVGEKTLRKYSVPINLSRFKGWQTTEEDLGYIGEEIDKVRHFRLISPEMADKLELVDKRTLESGLYGSNPEGLFKPK